MELSILGSYQEICKKTVKDLGGNKNRSDEFLEFIYYIADLIGPLYFSFFIEQHIYL